MLAMSGTMVVRSLGSTGSPSAAISLTRVGDVAGGGVEDAVGDQLAAEPCQSAPHASAHDLSPPPIGYVTAFFVEERYRNADVGRALLAAMNSAADQLPFDTLIVWPSERAASAYPRVGFVGRAPRSVGWSGCWPATPPCGPTTSGWSTPP